MRYSLLHCFIVKAGSVTRQRKLLSLLQDWECGASFDKMFPCGWEGSILTPRDPWTQVFVGQPRVRTYCSIAAPTTTCGKLAAAFPTDALTRLAHLPAGVHGRPRVLQHEEVLEAVLRGRARSAARAAVRPGVQRSSSLVCDIIPLLHQCSGCVVAQSPHRKQQLSLLHSCLQCCAEFVVHRDRVLAHSKVPSPGCPSRTSLVAVDAAQQMHAH